MVLKKQINNILISIKENTALINESKYIFRNIKSQNKNQGKQGSILNTTNYMRRAKILSVKKFLVRS